VKFLYFILILFSLQSLQAQQAELMGVVGFASHPTDNGIGISFEFDNTINMPGYADISSALQYVRSNTFSSSLNKMVPINTFQILVGGKFYLIDPTKDPKFYINVLVGPSWNSITMNKPIKTPINSWGGVMRYQQTPGNYIRIFAVGYSIGLSIEKSRYTFGWYIQSPRALTILKIGYKIH
jgi:hypothetical protein|tara:strand:- start:661 stop:1203 length:543 start_codon:yes stop_codon:yes gene_type:complete